MTVLTTLAYILTIASLQGYDDLGCSSPEAKETVTGISDRLISKHERAVVSMLEDELKNRSVVLQNEIDLIRAKGRNAGLGVDCALGIGDSRFDYDGRLTSDTEQLAKLSNAKLPSVFIFSLERIITTDKSQFKTTCKALLMENTDQGFYGSREITYSLETTDDGKLFANVWGLQAPASANQE